SSEQYFVRCLPHDFPAFSVNQIDDTSPNWFLTGTINTLGAANYAVILDERGAAVWYHKTTEPVLDLKRLPNGHLAWTALLGNAFGTRADGAYEAHTLDGALVHRWQTACTADQGDTDPAHCPTDHHDLVPVPGTSDMLMATYHLRTGVDLSAIGMGTNMN